jgi:hypothetical protein
MKTIKTNNRSRKSASIGKTRWAAYAAAGAATALGGTHSMEADIHYSGPINAVFKGRGQHIETFQLDQPDNVISFVHKLDEYAGVRLYTECSCARAVRGYSTRFASKLAFGENISAGAFVSSLTTYWAVLQSNRGAWGDPGVGFVGFRFNGSTGFRYGWARVKMFGQERHNNFKLLDYAFADAGEPIFAGQTSSAEQAPDQAPDQGSLGGLALGAAGLLAWRKSRSRTAR